MVTRESEATVIGLSFLSLFCLALDLSHFICVFYSLCLSFVSVPWTGRSFLLAPLLEIS